MEGDGLMEGEKRYTAIRFCIQVLNYIQLHCDTSVNAVTLLWIVHGEVTKRELPRSLCVLPGLLREQHHGGPCAWWSHMDRHSTQDLQWGRTSPLHNLCEHPPCTPSVHLSLSVHHHVDTGCDKRKATKLHLIRENGLLGRSRRRSW